MKSLKHKKIILIVLVCVIGVFGVKKMTYDNPNFLLKITSGSNIPSDRYYFCLERLYELSGKTDLLSNVLSDIEQYENQKSYLEIVMVYGVSGSLQRPELMIDLLEQELKKPTHPFLEHTIVQSMGNSGDATFVPYLKELLQRVEYKDHAGSLRNIATSIYLLTGEKITISRNGKNYEIFDTASLKRASKAIAISRGRQRTFDEMLMIDDRFRSSEWSNFQ